MSRLCQRHLGQPVSNAHEVQSHRRQHLFQVRLRRAPKQRTACEIVPSTSALRAYSSVITEHLQLASARHRERESELNNFAPVRSVYLFGPACHSFTIWSSLPAARVEPSGENSTNRTASVCPLSAATSWRVSTSQIFTVRSSPPVAI